MSVHINGIETDADITIDIERITTTQRLANAVNATSSFHIAHRSSRNVLVNDKYVIGVIDQHHDLFPTSSKRCRQVLEDILSNSDSYMDDESYILSLEYYLMAILDSLVDFEHHATSCYFIKFEQHYKPPVFAFIEFEYAISPIEAIIGKGCAADTTRITVCMCISETVESIRQNLTVH